VAIGYVLLSGFRQHAVRWDRAGAITDLGLLAGGDVSVPRGLGRDGPIVGAATVDGPLDFQAVRWDRRGTMYRLVGLPGGRRSDAFAVRGRTIFGSSYTANDEIRAVSWNWRGEIAELGTLPGGNLSVATKVGTNGVVIGYATTASGEFHAVAWVSG
jgi:uncharacterized membrane protein